MKVLYVIDGLWVGGTERSLAELLPHLPAVGIDPAVYALRRRSRGVQAEVEAAGIDVAYGDGQSLFAAVRDLRRRIIASRPDLVHAALFRANLVSRLACIGTGALLVNSVVNTPYAPERRADPAAPQRLSWVRAVDVVTGRLFVDRFHAVSEVARVAAIRDQAIPPDRIDTVHRGRDLERLAVASGARARVRAALGVSETAPVLLCVGRQDYQKNLPMAVQAFGGVQASAPETWLWLAGREGTESAAVREAIASVADSGRVLLLGHRNDVPSLMSAADLLLFPSRFEGLPGTLIEAMAAGLPAIASDIAQNREVAGDNGGVEFAATEDSADMVATAQQIMRDPEMMELLRAAGPRRVRENFTIQRSASKMCSLYQSVLADCGASLS